jgi:hypothetical protein
MNGEDKRKNGIGELESIFEEAVTQNRESAIDHVVLKDEVAAFEEINTSFKAGLELSRHGGSGGSSPGGVENPVIFVEQWRQTACGPLPIPGTVTLNWKQFLQMQSPQLRQWCLRFTRENLAPHAMQMGAWSSGIQTGANPCISSSRPSNFRIFFISSNPPSNACFSFSEGMFARKLFFFSRTSTAY